MPAPEPLKGLVRSSTVLNAIKKRMLNLAARYAFHDEVYDSVYYETLDKWTRKSAEVVAESVIP